eukprot:320377-Rhodomonas_salina.2
MVILPLIGTYPIPIKFKVVVPNLVFASASTYRLLQLFVPGGSSRLGNAQLATWPFSARGRRYPGTRARRYHGRRSTSVSASQAQGSPL